jgi:hypothetical protein
MGSSNSNCVRNDCFYDCCGFDGYCVNYEYQCYYYYSRLSAGAIVGIIFAVLVCCFIICLSAYCLRRCYRRHNQDQGYPPH